MTNWESPLGVLLLQLIWMTVSMAFIGQLQEGELKKWLHYQSFTSCFQVPRFSSDRIVVAVMSTKIRGVLLKIGIVGENSTYCWPEF